MAQHDHEIVVGNVGSVYVGANGFEASVAYNTYIGKSMRGEGRTAGESVTWLRDGDIHKEYVATEYDEEES